MGLHPLTIDPGTRIIAPAHSDDTAGGSNTALTELIINGSLSAKGTVENSIFFTSDAEIKDKGDWGGIHGSWALGAKNMEVDHCTVEYATTGIQWDISAGLHELSITNAIIQNNSSHGLYVEGRNGSTSNVTVSDLRFKRTRSTGSILTSRERPAVCLRQSRTTRSRTTGHTGCILI